MLQELLFSKILVEVIDYDNSFVAKFLFLVFSKKSTWLSILYQSARQMSRYGIPVRAPKLKFPIFKKFSNLQVSVLAPFSGFQIFRFPFWLHFQVFEFPLLRSSPTFRYSNFQVFRVPAPSVQPESFEFRSGLISGTGSRFSEFPLLRSSPCFGGCASSRFSKFKIF